MLGGHVEMTLVYPAPWNSVFCFSWDVLIRVDPKFTVNWTSSVYLEPDGEEASEPH